MPLEVADFALRMQIWKVAVGATLHPKVNVRFQTKQLQPHEIIMARKENVEDINC